MTMQSSGPISEAQAGIECGYGYPATLNTAGTLLAALGNRPPGQYLAWSYWYGQSYLSPIPYQLMVDFQLNDDRDFQVWFNYRTGAYTYAYDANNNPRILYWTPYHAPIGNVIGSYTSFSGTAVLYAGRGPMTVRQDAIPSTDWTISTYYDDNNFNGAAVYGTYLYVEAHNRFG